MYEWNKFQTEELRVILGDLNASLWTLPLIHGSFQQVKQQHTAALSLLTLMN
jgi:hypothetical protein